ncbi:MAG: hypothetical protein ACI4AM_01315 [Muribaculaceae bacterium]
MCNVNYGTVENCYAVVSFSIANNTPTSNYRPGIITTNYGTFTNNRYLAVGTTVGYDSSNRVDTYADLRANFSENTAFAANSYLNPVNVNAKHYTGTNCELQAVTIDAIRPLSFETPNTVVYLDEADARAWELPNVAINNETAKTTTVPTYIIDPNEDYAFWLGPDATVQSYTKEGNVTFPLTLNDTGWYSLCLPCDLYLKDLPEGSKIRAVGEVVDNKVRLIEVMYVPAGAACVVYIPTENTGTYTLNLSGTIADLHNPQKISAYSSLDGALEATTKSNVAVLAVDSEGNPYFKHMESADLKPYTGYIADATADITTTDVTGAFLDQSYISNTYTIEQYEGQAPTIAVIASYPKDKWSAICLPFALTLNQAQELFGADYEIEDFKFAHFDEGASQLTMFFGRVDMADIQCPIEAGKAYLIKPSKDFDSTTLLTGYTISSTLTGAQDEVYAESFGTMQITIEPTLDYFETKKTIYSYSSDSNIMKVSQTILGLGFYVKVNSQKSEFVQDIQLYHGVTSGVESPTSTEVEVVGIYDLSGRRLTAPQRGVNILLMSDGSARKIIRQ